MNKLYFLSSAFSFIISGFLTAQTVVRDKDYTLQYNGDAIDITFNAGATLTAVNSKTAEARTITPSASKAFSYTITGFQPSEFLKLDYRLSDGSTSAHKSALIACKSLSTGVVNVYFNHPVTASLAQYQPAVSLGNTLDDMLITYINNCQSTLDIAIYNSESPSASAGIAGAINAAYSRGVQVRVIYDGSTSSNMIPLLNSAIPRLASPTSSAYGIMHNKFVSFDANSSDPNRPWVWTGSTNWTVAQIDGPDKNNAVVVQDQALAQAYRMEFEEMWGSSGMVPNLANSKFGPYKTNNTPHNFVIGGRVVENYFSPSDGTTSHIVDAINSANSDIEIATMLVTRDDIRDALIAKHTAGLNIEQGVFDTQNPSGNDIPALKAAIGTNKMVQYAGSGVMHHKFLIVDNFNASSDPLVLTGSHNWSSSAETRNDENILVIHDNIIADQYYQAFAYLYSQAGGVLNTVDLESSKKSLVLYPNPTDGVVYLKFDGTTSGISVNIKVYTVLGSKIIDFDSPAAQSTSINLADYPAGLYFVNITAGDKVYQSKIIKK